MHDSTIRRRFPRLVQTASAAISTRHTQTPSRPSNLPSLIITHIRRFARSIVSRPLSLLSNKIPWVNATLYKQRAHRAADFSRSRLAWCFTIYITLITSYLHIYIELAHSMIKERRFILLISHICSRAITTTVKRSKQRGNVFSSHSEQFAITTRFDSSCFVIMWSNGY